MTKVTFPRSELVVGIYLSTNNPSTKSKTTGSWLDKLVLIAAFAGSTIHLHIVYPGGTIDGSFSIAYPPTIEHLVSDNTHSPASSPSPSSRRAVQQARHRPP